LQKNILVTLANARPGQDAEYTAWYEGTHIPEVCETPGVMRATRFKPVLCVKTPAWMADSHGDLPWDYLTIFEFEGEPQDVIDAMKARRETEMHLSDTGDRDAGVSWVFSQCFEHES
jgi:hypothetical protein